MEGIFRACNEKARSEMGRAVQGVQRLDEIEENMEEI